MGVLKTLLGGLSWIAASIIIFSLLLGFTCQVLAILLFITISPMVFAGAVQTCFPIVCLLVVINMQLVIMWPGIKKNELSQVILCLLWAFVFGTLNFSHAILSNDYVDEAFQSAHFAQIIIFFHSLWAIYTVVGSLLTIIFFRLERIHMRLLRQVLAERVSSIST